MAAIKRFTPDEFEKLIWLLQIIIVRWQIIRGGRPGVIERTCARLALDIWNEKVKFAKNAFDYLKEPYGTDAEFRSSFVKYQNSSNAKSAFLLRKLESHERDVKKGQSSRELIAAKLSVEHVLPRNPSSEWGDIINADPAIIDDCAQLLGNLCLVTEGRNRDLSRNSFQKKSPVLKESDILLTKMVGENENWNRDRINQRQEYLAGRAVDIWRFV